MPILNKRPQKVQKMGDEMSEEQLTDKAKRALAGEEVPGVDGVEEENEHEQPKNQDAERLGKIVASAAADFLSKSKRPMPKAEIDPEELENFQKASKAIKQGLKTK